MAAFIEHPRLCAEAVEARAYQIEAVSDCLSAPTLLVLPTALGKTPIAMAVGGFKLRIEGRIGGGELTSLGRHEVR